MDPAVKAYLDQAVVNFTDILYYRLKYPANAYLTDHAEESAERWMNDAKQCLS